MDLITSVFTIYGNVNDTDRQYKILAKKLIYQIKKSQHLIKSQKVKSVPSFMLQNLQHKLQQAKRYLQKIQCLLTEDRIPLQFFYFIQSKQKIKLSLPFNKTNLQVKSALQQLQKAQQDVNDHCIDPQPEFNGKRSIQDLQKLQKRQQTMAPINIHEDVNDQDIQQALMGPTIQQDAAIEFTKNKYIQMIVQIHGSQKLISIIKQTHQQLLVYKKKIHIKFQNPQKKDIQQLQLYSLGRLLFKPVYSKIKPHYPDIDRISKMQHFSIKLRRKRENIKHHSMKNNEQKNEQNINSSQKNQMDEFFSFPCTQQQQMVVKEIDTIVLQRSPEKSVYISDITGAWKKMQELEKQLCKGQQIAPYIAPNSLPFSPQLYFKIHFQILE